MPQFLKVAEKHQIYSQKAIESYRQFLKDPLGWQRKRRLTPPESDR